MKKTILTILSVIALIFIIQACKTYYFRANYQDTNSLIHETNNLQTKPFLKAHLKNGNVYILNNSWEIDTSLNIVSGIGIKYDFNRNQTYQGSIDIPIDSVVIFETNKKIDKPESGRITALSILAGLDVAIGIICIINPKACFGSCPTFYINDSNNLHFADAEGFSNAISPSMEYGDIDALQPMKIKQNEFSITMKNEALETHCIREAKILAYPIQKGERVFQTPSSEFYLCKNIYSPISALASEGDILHLLNFPDHIERFSLSDENNLLSKEEIYLTFNNINNPGLILNFRHTLMTTYLFYSALGFMGDHVSDVFAILETDEKKRNDFDATTKALGGIDCYLWNDKSRQWEFQSTWNESGPIAINQQIIPLKHLPGEENIKIKLVLNKGFWRIDYAALTNLEKQIDPIAILPSSIFNNGKIDNVALNQLNHPDQYLISMPGSDYEINFKMPRNDTEYELFLYSKGYYLEWMRTNWIKEKDLNKLKQMVFQPELFLKEEAKNFKLYESTMEKEFWDSKIDANCFSFFEN